MVPRGSASERVRSWCVESPAMGSYALRGGLVWDGSADAAVEGAVVVDGELHRGGWWTSRSSISGCTVVPGLIEGGARASVRCHAGMADNLTRIRPAKMLLRMAESGRRMLRASPPCATSARRPA